MTVNQLIKHLKEYCGNGEDDVLVKIGKTKKHIAAVAFTKTFITPTQERKHSQSTVDLIGKDFE